MTHTNHSTSITPADTMEAEEKALVKDERTENKRERAAATQEHDIAKAADKPNMTPQPPIQPQVALHTDEISECHEPTTADEMEAEERDLVIKDSVDDVLTYTNQPLSDEIIRKKALTEEAQIDPSPKDINQC